MQDAVQPGAQHRAVVLHQIVRGVPAPGVQVLQDLMERWSWHGLVSGHFCGLVNMGLPLAVLVVSSCKTSQCSTIFPPVRRKMSTPIMTLGPMPE